MSDLRVQTNRHLLIVAYFTICLTGGVVGCRLVKDTELTVRWKTESEFDIVGFNLYRSESPEGPFSKINGDLIPAATDPLVGGEHSYTDRGVVRGVTYYYQLETVDRHGNVSRSEPLTITAGS